MAKILVTGDAGFIGSHVAEVFLDRGFENELGWSPTLSLEEGLEKTVAYFQEKEQVV